MAEKKKYISVSDMFDGGGAGKSGVDFEGGILGTLGNALGGPKIFGNAFMDESEAPGDRTRVKHVEPVSYFDDLFDGGGIGYSGDYFDGTLYSSLANMLGIDPIGSERGQSGMFDPAMMFAQFYGGMR
jgi:hypothetical protein